MKIQLFSFLLIFSFFVGCKETTTSSVVTDIASISIDNTVTSIYSTDQAVELSATVTHTNGSTGDATDALTWNSSDSSIIIMSANSIYGGTTNGGDANITASYAQFSDTTSINVIKLTDFNISQVDDTIDINSTGAGSYEFQALASFEDNATGRVVYNNLTWDMNNSATYSTSNGVTTITFITGTTEVNATVFEDDNETNITKTLTFTIN
ncbi:hypothetical protein [Sulfurimonas sp.]|uniref:hypothetical protein n=1 Tax=Sulfurimonas sp. TaxID=2022749 RepID=UPI003D0EE10E